MKADFLDRTRFEALRNERGVSWGRPLRLHASVSSTNDLALEAALGDMKTGGVFVAQEQTAGRGRRGNLWHSPPGENLTFTILARYPSAPRSVQSFSLVVGLAVRAAVASRLPNESASLPNESASQPHEAGQVRVKWPNDVYIGDKKLAGILVESRVRGAELALAIGIGVNVLTRDFGPFAEERTSLALAMGASDDAPELEKESLLVDILRELETRTRLFVGSGLDALLPELERYDLLRGRRFSVDGAPGIGAGIDRNGRLLFQPDGESVVLVVETGSIELVRTNRASSSVL